MDFLEFGTGAQILRDLGLKKLRVLTNQPRRLRAVSGYGLDIVEWLPLGESDAIREPEGVGQARDAGEAAATSDAAAAVLDAAGPIVDAAGAARQP